VIHRADPDGTLLIGQPAHAWLSGRMARAWSWPFQPWEDVCLAAEQHDIGMAAWDTRPQLDPAAGLPYSFGSMPREMHVELWRDAARLLLPQGRYPALLVSLHGTGLYERHVPADQLDQEPTRSYLAAEREFQAALRTSLDAEPTEVDDAVSLIRCWDWISLFLCTASSERSTMEAVPSCEGETSTLELTWIEGDPTHVRVNPWPFLQPSLVLPVEARLLRGRFGDQEAMRRALAEAEWHTITLRLSPGES
jgi:hypothetical protein